MSEYVPAESPLIITMPATLDVSVTVVGEPPFFVYRTVYVVEADNPVKLIDPVDDPHAVGLVPELLAIAGTGNTVTVVLAEGDRQLPSTEVTVTLYTPLLAAVAFAITGFC